MVKHLTCSKCHKETATLTYEESRIYKVSCPCGCEYSFEHSSMKCAEEYHYKMLELYGEIERADRLKAENERYKREVEAMRNDKGYPCITVLERELSEENNALRAENHRLSLLGRQKCGGCGEPLCKDITLCKVCVDKILEENAKLRELVGLAVEHLKIDKHCLLCANHRNSGGTCIGVGMCGQSRSKWKWKHTDKLKEIDGKGGSLNEMTTTKFYKELNKLAPLGLVEKALSLYESQTCEFIKFGKVVNETQNNIDEFNLFCINNKLGNLVVVPIIFNIQAED